MTNFLHGAKADTENPFLKV